MNNEPVAWMELYKGEPNNLDWDKSNLNYGSEFHDVIPLYLHDWDINKVSIAFWHDSFVEVKNPQTGEVARFELKKASEK